MRISDAQLDEPFGSSSVQANISSFSEDYTSEKVVNRCHFNMTTKDSFEDGFKLKSLILAQNERWRQA